MTYTSIVYTLELIVYEIHINIVYVKLNQCKIQIDIVYVELIVCKYTLILYMLELMICIIQIDIVFVGTDGM